MIAQGDLFRYPSAPGHKVRETSRDAAAAISGRVAALQERAFRALERAGYRGLTADEVAEAIKVPWPSVRPRISELAAQGRIEPTGERRKNESGRSAEVWRIKTA